MDIPKSIQLQRQIMENSKSINEYIKDFDNWVNEMNTKDNIITQIKKQQPEEEPIKASYEEDENEKKNKIELAHKEALQNKFKRDKNSIKDYYDNWDKVNADAELVDVESSISINSNNNNNNNKIFTSKELYNENKKSNAQKNLSINITNTRNQLNKIYNNNNNNSQVEKLKNEANINFAIQNYNKSIELYSYAIALMPKNDKSTLMINLYNNRGNCQIKQQNHKEGIKDFNKVLELDPKNLKALYRRGICYYNTQKFNLSFEDLNNAFKLAETEKEKEMIKNEMDKTINSINSLISRERGKMEKFIYNEDTKFKKIKIIDINNANVLNDDDSLIIKKEEENNKENINKNNNKNDKNNVNENKKNKKIEPKKILKKEEIKQFVYDSTLNNINSSSFKYAFRNLGNDFNAKKEYLLKINPIFFPQIFKTDLDKDILLDIIKCLKLVEEESQIIEYLKNIMKIPRIKLIVQLIPKKQKNEFFEIFDILEKGDFSSEIIPIKDFFLN